MLPVQIQTGKDSKSEHGRGRPRCRSNSEEKSILYISDVSGTLSKDLKLPLRRKRSDGKSEMMVPEP